MKAFRLSIFAFFAPLVLAGETNSIQFHRCVGQDGEVHMTHLPKELLDKNCQMKTSYHDYQLDRDYKKVQDKAYVKQLQTDDVGNEIKQASETSERGSDIKSELNLRDENIDAALDELQQQQ